MIRSVLYFFTLFFHIAISCLAQGDSSNDPDLAQVDLLLEKSKSQQWIDPSASLQYADSALHLSRNQRLTKRVASAQNLRGFCYWAFGDNELAIGAALEALSIGELLQQSSIAAEAHYILARAYMDMNEPEKMNEHLLAAERLAISTKEDALYCNIINLKGVAKVIGDQQDSALYYYQRAYEIGKARGIPAIHFPKILSNIGECHAKTDRAKAFQYFTDALMLSRETQNAIAEASTTDIIGHAYLQANQIEKAESNLESALVLSRKLGLRRVIRHAYAGLVQIKLRQGEGDEAVSYLRRYYAVRDSLLNSSKVREIVELEARHELQLKEQQLEVLEKEKKISSLWNNLLIVMIIVLIAIAVTMYLLQRYRYQKNREILNLEIDFLTRQRHEAPSKNPVDLGDGENEVLESQDQKLLKRAIALVEENIGDSTFTVEKLSDHMNMSRTSLHRRIKSATGFPPSELIRSIRLRKAARLIAAKVDTVSQIALLVGFDDYSHFSKSFKKHFGVPPSEFQSKDLHHQESANQLS